MLGHQQCLNVDTVIFYIFYFSEGNEAFVEENYEEAINVRK